jgi:hypothetical protein
MVEPKGAAQRLQHLGFLLESPSSGETTGWRLLVALRSQPTLEHFDVEVVRFWRTGDDRKGHPRELNVETPAPLRTEFSWGPLALVDRREAQNEFATLGGELRVDRAGPGMIVAAFASPGPILRLGGHSQAADAEGLELGAFFGRMMVPIDFEPGVEQAISAATPLERYAAFVAFEESRYSSHAALRAEEGAAASVIAGEAHRLASDEPASWDAGQELLERMGLRD